MSKRKKMGATNGKDGLPQKGEPAATAVRDGCRASAEPTPAEEARRTMFELLQAGGYDVAEVRYASRDYQAWVEQLDLYKGEKRVGRKHATRELLAAVADYLNESVDDYCCGTEEGGYGTATLNVAERSAAFEHIDFYPEYAVFIDDGSEITHL